MGQPDESRIRKACNRAKQVVVYAYGARAVPVWWEKLKSKVSRFDNLRVIELPGEETQALAALAQKAMTLQCTIQDGQVGIGDEQSHVTIEPVTLYPQ